MSTDSKSVWVRAGGREAPDIGNKFTAEHHHKFIVYFHPVTPYSKMLQKRPVCFIFMLVKKICG